MLRKIGWSLLFSFSVIGIVFGILLPIIPHIPFLILSIYSLHHLAPAWLEKQKIYRKFLRPLEEKFKHMTMSHKKS
jgi:uncharacterized membrane protein YbaN (DUF454 family)